MTLHSSPLLTPVLISTLESIRCSLNTQSLLSLMIDRFDRDNMCWRDLYMFLCCWGCVLTRSSSCILCVPWQSLTSFLSPPFLFLSPFPSHPLLPFVLHPLMLILLFMKYIPELLGYQSPWWIWAWCHPCNGHLDIHPVFISHWLFSFKIIV